MEMASMMDVLEANFARWGLRLPRRLPMLFQNFFFSDDGGGCENTESYRTAVATLRAKGAWKVVDAETSKTD